MDTESVVFLLQVACSRTSPLKVTTFPRRVARTSTVFCSCSPAPISFAIFVARVDHNRWARHTQNRKLLWPQETRRAVWTASSARRENSSWALTQPNVSEAHFFVRRAFLPNNVIVPPPHHGISVHRTFLQHSPCERLPLVSKRHYFTTVINNSEGKQQGSRGKKEKMFNDSNTVICRLENAATTDEMIIAANQIAESGLIGIDLTNEEARRITNALTGAVRWVTNADSVTAWGRLVALTCNFQSDQTRDAFAAPAILAAITQMGPTATTPDAVQWLTSAVSIIATGARVAAFTPVITAIFPQLAPHATTPDSVQWLTNALTGCMSHATQEKRDAFATPAIVALFLQLARHATTAESVHLLTGAISNITNGPKQAPKDAFATPAIVSMFTQLAPYATSPESIEWLTRAICSITYGAAQSTKDVFVTPAIVDMFSEVATRAMTGKSVQWLASAVWCITNGTTQPPKDAFATPVIVDMFSHLAAHATTPESVQWLTNAIYSITAGTSHKTRDAFATPTIVVMFSHLAAHATTPDSVHWLTTAIHNIAYGLSQTRKDVFATPPIVVMFTQLAPYATTAESVFFPLNCHHQHHERDHTDHKSCVRHS